MKNATCEMHAMHSIHLRVPDVSAATFPHNIGIKGGTFRQYRRSVAVDLFYLEDFGSLALVAEPAC